MTDEEVICTWMEPRGRNRWWTLAGWPNIEVNGQNEPDRNNPIFSPVELDLDAIHEVEARLTDEQRNRYIWQIDPPEWGGGGCNPWPLLHANAPTRIKALAQVLGPEVEKGKSE